MIALIVTIVVESSHEALPLAGRRSMNFRSMTLTEPDPLTHGETRSARRRSRLGRSTDSADAAVARSRIARTRRSPISVASSTRCRARRRRAVAACGPSVVPWPSRRCSARLPRADPATHAHHRQASLHSGATAAPQRPAEVDRGPQSAAVPHARRSHRRTSSPDRTWIVTSRASRRPACDDPRSDVRRRRTNVLFMLVISTACTLFLAATTSSTVMLYVFALSLPGAVRLRVPAWRSCASARRRVGPTTGSIATDPVPVRVAAIGTVDSMRSALHSPEPMGL